jgi:hypothetical protein
MNRTVSRPLGSSPSVLLAHTERLVQEAIAGILQQAAFLGQGTSVFLMRRAASHT